MLIHLAMALGGLVLICWGLPASHRLKKPLDVLAALAVLAGVVVALLGVLLLMVPAFFKS